MARPHLRQQVNALWHRLPKDTRLPGSRQGTPAYQLADLATYQRAAVVVEERYWRSSSTHSGTNRR